MTRKHDARMTDEWKRQFRPMTREGAGSDWLPKPLSPSERQARLARYEDQRVTSKARFGKIAGAIASADDWARML